VNDFSKALNAGEQIDALFLDFTVPKPSIRCHCHCHMNFHIVVLQGICLTGLRTFYMRNLKLLGHCSEPCPILSGAPQRTIFAPLLLINDIVQNINCTIRLYADDILIYTTVYCLADFQRLQEDLHTLQSWAMFANRHSTN